MAGDSSLIQKVRFGESYAEKHTLPKESVYRGCLLIPVDYGQHKKFIIATLDRKFVSDMGEYRSKGEAKKVICNLSQS